MELKKGINFFGVFSIASGAMISSGIFILPGLAFSRTGPSVSIAYFLAGILAMVGILGAIELSTAMPKAGGDYYFVNKTFGPYIGTITGFLGWFALSLKSAFAIFGICEIVSLMTGINPMISGLIFTLFFVGLNIIGVKEAAVFQNILVVGLLGILITYIIAGMPNIDQSNYKPFFTVGFNDIFITAGFVFISFGGLLKVINVSEEVINPKRNIPLGILASIITVTILYTIVTYVLTGTLASESFSGSLTPVADSARIIMGKPGFLIVNFAALLAFFTTANAGIMSASRYPVALSRDKLVPPKFANINKRFKTPTFAIVFTGAIIYGSLLLPLEMLVKSASTVILTSYVLTNVAVIIFRESRITNYKPSFRSPFYPWLQIVTIALFMFIIFDIGLKAIEISAGFLFISSLVYLLYGRKSNVGDYALLHLLKRITDSRLTEDLLEDELRDVIISRDEIAQDSFDSLIKNANVHDIEGPMDYHYMLRNIAEKVSPSMKMEPKEFVDKFEVRLNEFNPAITPFVAIPHIITEGEDHIVLHLIRSKKGIKFSEHEDAVKAIFMLAGSHNRRVLHLKTVAAIATLASEENFQEKWLSAKDQTEIKNLLLLSGRIRFK
jgi:amino acid transporter